MGGSESKSTVKNEVNTVIDNEVDIKMIKETVNKNIMNTIKEQASSCSAAVQAKQKQKRKVGNVKGGSVTFGKSRQEQKVSLSLSCVDVTKSENNMANDIAQAFESQLETKFDTQAMAKLEGNAKAQATTGALALGSTSTDSNVENIHNLNISNKISKTMKDMVTNEIQRNFHTKTLKERISNLQAEQAIEEEVGDVEDAEVTFEGGEQVQDVTLVMEAIAEDTSINNTIDKIATQLNSIDTTGVTTSAKTEATATAESISESKGVDSVVDSVFSGVAGVISSIGGIFGQFTWIIIAVVIGIVAILGVFFMTGGQETLQAGIAKAGGGYSQKGGGGFINSKTDQDLIKAFKSLSMNVLLEK